MTTTHNLYAASAAYVAPMLSVFVPGKPVSTNAMYAHSKYGAHYLTEAAKAWRDAVWAEVYKANHKLGMKPAYWRLPIRVRLTFQGSRADADNLVKCTLDGLKLGISVDDRHFTPVEVWVNRGRGRPSGCHVELWQAARG